MEFSFVIEKNALVNSPKSTVKTTKKEQHNSSTTPAFHYIFSHGKSSVKPP